MQDTIHIRDELVLEAHPDGPHILLRREGEPGAVRIFLIEVRYLSDAMCVMTAGMVGFAVHLAPGTLDDLPFGSAYALWLIAIAIAAMLLLRPAPLMVFSVWIVSHFLRQGPSDAWSPQADPMPGASPPQSG